MAMCHAGPPACFGFQKNQMLEPLNGDSELSSDDESPCHGHPVEVMAHLVQSSTVAYRHLLGLLKYDQWESPCDLLRSFGEGLPSNTRASTTTWQGRGR